MSEPFIGEIRMFAGNFAPRGWAFCSGQLLPISPNAALFSILGTTYGGNGQTTFALPDLRGRAAIHAGQGPGLSNFTLGEQGGNESVTILSTQMPAHTHLLNCNSGDGDQTSAQGNVPATTNESATRSEYPTYSATPNATMSPQAIGLAGGSQPLPIASPFTVVSFIIALEGIFPSRN